MTELPTSMRAVVLDAPGPPEALQVREVPVPVPAPGEVLIRVKAFGLNRSELHTRLGLADGVVFPRVPGIEASGVVAECPGGEFEPGAQVVTMMGGMGRTFDGGYAEFTCVPSGQVINRQARRPPLNPTAPIPRHTNGAWARHFCLSGDGSSRPRAVADGQTVQGSSALRAAPRPLHRAVVSGGRDAATPSGLGVSCPMPRCAVSSPLRRQRRMWCTGRCGRRVRSGRTCRVRPSACGAGRS